MVEYRLQRTIVISLECIVHKKSKTSQRDDPLAKGLPVENGPSGGISSSRGPAVSDVGREDPFPWLPSRGAKGSEAVASRSFDWLIQPIGQERFFRELWEQKPLLVKRHQPGFYGDLMSCQQLDRILRERQLYFTENVDLTTYRGGVRETHNPPGRAHAAVVWDSFQQGCSVRLLNPQTYSRQLWRLCATLQEFFGSMVGANLYLTPAGSQGFAPHYDDIEAFVLQLEGQKLWRVYAPRDPSEELPRFSSGNFTKEEVGEPLLTTLLEPGDLLYFPRGFIHQACTGETSHSLHLTLSTCQRNTWGDLLEKVRPPRPLVDRAVGSPEAEVSVRCLEQIFDRREVVPNLQPTVQANPRREAFLAKMRGLFERLWDFLPVDAAADQMVKAHLHEALPPLLSQQERECSVHGGERWHEGRVVDVQELEPDTAVRLESSACRLVVEEDSVRLYHSLDNSRVYQERDPQWVELDAERAPAVEALLHAYPGYLRIQELPLQGPTECMELASLLYDRGLLLTREAARFRRLRRRRRRLEGPRHL
ncbi:hypothetical protein HPB47_012545 [Ixodes persulcatus]|uniref:Uncharacterized protein n=1 Tax=Ixodes persulcatus TaxID=34615 RepID=A0AC60NT71_IXOPE|nr:hypothetical protein HPB47_012545 [Ixodes persulcatus]